MKRFHVHLNVADLSANVRFYSELFASQPTVIEQDYAKWMLDDPRVNFAISTHGVTPGIGRSPRVADAPVTRRVPVDDQMGAGP